MLETIFGVAWLDLFNPNHDPVNGQFTGASAGVSFAPDKGAGAGSALSISDKLKAAGVKIDAPAHLKARAEQAAAYLTDDYVLKEVLHGLTIKVQKLPPNLHGRHAGNTLLISETDLQRNVGFASAIMRHELEHKRLTLKGVRTSEQEKRVRYMAGIWAQGMYNKLHTTAPEDARGFYQAAKDQGIQMR